jgi:uncharacterized paraquat-inducible protein A
MSEVLPETGQNQPAAELMICPECGSSAMVTLNRRESRDFCRKCDFPLFWTPSTVLRDPTAQSAEESLRRLPGTVGRATVASQRCPHCAEPNALSAQVCVRCGLSMHVEAPPPPPEPVYLPPPEPVYYEPEPEPDRIDWWVWVLIGLSLVVIVVLVVLGATHHLG